MKYCVLGAGRTGQAVVAYLMRQGQQVGLWDRDEEKCRHIAENGVTVEGLYAGTWHPKVFSDMAEAAQAEVLLVMTTASGHLPLAQRLCGKLGQNQIILVLNGNMGAWEMYQVLKDELQAKGSIVAETGGMLLLCDYNAAGILSVNSLKREMNLAAIPAGVAGQVIGRLKDEFPQFYAVNSVIETSLNNSNPVLHAPITLFNISRVENGEDFGYYSSATTPSILAFTEKVDAERCAVIAAMGAKALTCVEIINSFWPEKYSNLWDVIKNNKSYMAGRGPKALDYRYITEDVPYGIAPLAALGGGLNVPTPCIDAMLVCYSNLLGQDFAAKCPGIEGFAETVTA